MRGHSSLRSASQIFIVLSTAGSLAQARRLASKLVKEHAAACVNIVPRIESTYWWKGKVERGGESLLILKTGRSRLRRLAKRLKELHPYEVPEILALPVSFGNPAYLRWFGESLMMGSDADG